MRDILLRARESLNTQQRAKTYGCDMPYPADLIQDLFTEVQRLRDAIGDAWDDGNATGLNGRAYSRNRFMRAMTPAEHLDRAQTELAAGDLRTAQVHALIAIAGLLVNHPVPNSVAG